MKEFHSTATVGHSTRGSRYASESWKLIRNIMGLCMMVLVVGCGDDRSTGLKLAIIQEMPEASDSRVTIIDFDVKPSNQFELRMGETKYGIELIEVSHQARTVLIRRDGKEIRLKMGEGEQAGAQNP